MAPPTMKLANRSNMYTSVSIVFDNRENCKQCQPSLNGLVSTGVTYLVGTKNAFTIIADEDSKLCDSENLCAPY